MRIRMSDGSRRLQRRAEGPRTVEEATPPPPQLKGWKTKGDNAVKWFKDPKNKWAVNAFFGVLFTLGFLIISWMISPEWTKNRLSENFMFLVLAAVILITISLYIKSEIPYAMIAGRWLRLVTIITLIVYILLPNGYARRKIEDGRKSMADWFVSLLERKSEPITLPTPRRTASIPVRENKANIEAARRSFSEFLTPEQVVVMLNHCITESYGCNQFAPDGSLVKNQKQGSTAIGAMQIVESIHGERAAGLGLNLSEFDDQLAFSRILIEERIANGEPFDEDWATSRGSVPLQTRVTPDAENASLAGVASSRSTRVEPFTLSPTETTGWVEGIDRLSYLLITSGGGKIAIADTAGYHVIVVPEATPGKPIRISLDVYRGGRVTVLNANNEPDGESGLDITFEIRRW